MAQALNAKGIKLMCYFPTHFVGKYPNASSKEFTHMTTDILKEFGEPIQRAQQAVRQKPDSVLLRGGTYYLPEKLVFNAEDSGSEAAPVVYQAYGKEQPVISGSQTWPIIPSLA